MSKAQLNKEATEIIAELTAYYIELAEKVLALELEEPSISMEEAVSVWIMARSIKEEALATTELTGSDRHIPSIYDGVLGSAFGSVLTDLETVREGDIPTLSELMDSSADVLASADSKRVEILVEAASNIAHIALAVSKSEVQIALFCLSQTEKESATAIATSLLNSHVTLDEYARYKAQQWIGKAAWSSSESEPEE